MNIKKILVTGTITTLLVGLAGTGSALVLMHEKVRALEQERAQLAQKMKEKAAAARTRSVPKKKQAAKTPPRVPHVPETRIAADSTKSHATNDVPAELRVARTDYDGEMTLRLYLTQRPDMDVVRHYVSVTPLQEGSLTFEAVASMYR